MSDVVFSKPSIDDGKKIFDIVKNNPPLDVNSKYAYLLLSYHFSDTCIVAKKDTEIIGFITAYVPPNKKNTLFVWQAAVVPDFRGDGLASKMLFSILSRDECKDIEYLEATLAPSNRSSHSFLIGVTAELCTSFTKYPLFTENSFGDCEHEEENLVVIGPFDNRKTVEVTI